jgi:subtilisin family serine protease
MKDKHMTLITKLHYKSCLQIACVSLLALTTLATSCFKKPASPSNEAPRETSPQTATQETPGIVTAGSLPNTVDPNGQIRYLGGIITTRNVAGQIFIPIEATLSDGSFAAVQESSSTESLSSEEKISKLLMELQTSVKIIKDSVALVDVRYEPSVGFFTGFIALDDYPNLQKVTGLTHRVLLNPVVQQVSGRPTHELALPHSGLALGLHADRAVDPRASTDHFSGLERIGEDRFVKAIKNELGQVVDGSRVKVGVTDTGITFNHPSFFDAEGQSRITYMREFTGEGTIYFSDNTTFAAREATAAEVPAGANASEVIVITAKYIATPAGRTVPVADVLSEIKDQVFLVSPEIKASLLAEGSTARISALSEMVFAETASSEYVDLNHNGKNNDQLWVILLPYAETKKSKLYVDISGRGDFRHSKPVSDWNESKSTITAFSEKFGFDIQATEIMDSHEKPIRTITAGIVGFDPGNHGSHVAGIIGGRKTIANDHDGTKARGVAPNTQLMMNRVCANNGGCAATEAVIDLAKNGAEVINMSLGGLSPFNDGYGVQETVINRLSQTHNTLFVISAGNSGPGRQTIGSPSVASKALSIAATATRKMMERQYQYPGTGKLPSSSLDNEDFILFFSSRGPTSAGGFKPNISAPGSELSAIQLNAAAGARTGLDVYWGTSMAAPTASGAIALLIDAAKIYNVIYPDQALPLDNATLHRVISASARGFDVNSYNVKTGKRTLGQYTWIDQGHGMIDLVAAWKALKKARDSQLTQAVNISSKDGAQSPVALNYEVRVLRKNPNGIDYAGSVISPTPEGTLEPRFARGLYLDENSTESLVPVQIARRIPHNLLDRSDIGELTKQLATTADTFELETTIYGSHSQWLKAGSLGRLDCKESPSSKLTVVGLGAVDNFSPAPGGTPTSVGHAASTLYVCVDRSLVDVLAPGDHGAIIHAYRSIGGKRESTPAFEVPVYLTRSHAKMSGTAGYKIAGTIESFGVARNYVEIPKGVSFVKLTLEVPEATQVGTELRGCAGVEFMVLEGVNVAKPEELLPRTIARAQNCDLTGVTSNSRSVSYTRFQPTNGVWDIHVFGQYNYALSPYTLTVDFANVVSEVTSLQGTPEILNGTFKVTINESSLDVTPNAEKSEFKLTGYRQKRTPVISHQQRLRVKDAQEKEARVYASGVKRVVFTTGGLSGSDLDLEIQECDDEAGTKCTKVASSGGSTDEEKAEIIPLPGKYYFAEVIGYEIPSSAPVSFAFTETMTLRASESGTTTFEDVRGESFVTRHSFDVAASKYLTAADFTSKLWSAVGYMKINSEDGSGILRLDVEVTNP